FGTRSDTVNKTEIVLLITPRVVRNVARPGAKLEEFLSGTEAAIGAGPSGSADAGGAPASLGPSASSAPGASPSPGGAAPSAENQPAGARFSLQAPPQV